ncbi:hypothetical protein CMO95_00820 [Candidatus Woesearchaeota archaeon]|nr:hypothetical protein [Candidatus Woesearchaeota archaeon]
MSKNKSNSPFFAIGQGIDNILDYASIARAGQPTNFLGNAVYKIGEIISQLDFDKMQQNRIAKKIENLTDQEKYIEPTLEPKEVPVELEEMPVSNLRINLLDVNPKRTTGQVVKKQVEEIKKEVVDKTKPTVQSATVSPTTGEKVVIDNKGTIGTIQGTEGYDVSLKSDDLKGINANQQRQAQIQAIAREKNISIEEAEAIIKEEEKQSKISVGSAGDLLASSNQFLVTDLDANTPSGPDQEFVYKDTRPWYEQLLFGAESPEMIEAKKQDFLNNSGSSNKRLKSEILEIIEASRYKREGAEDTPLHRISHVLNSPYYRTDGKSYKYLRELTQPSASAQAAAASKSRFFSDFGLGPGSFNLGIENFNAQIKQENYKRKVQNDFDEDLTKELNSLNVDLDKSNVDGQQRKDLLDYVTQKKKELAGAFTKYTNGDIDATEYNLLNQKYNAEVDTLASDLGIIKTKAQEYIKQKDNIDLRASNPEAADFYETAIKNPNSIRIKTINNRSYFTGETNSGKKFKIEVGALTNGDASFMLTGKADPATYITNALKSMQDYTEEMRTKFGQGVGQLKDDTERDSRGNIVRKSKIREIGENKMLANFRQDSDTVRSLLSQIRGIDFDGYQTLINQDRNGDGKTDSTEIKQNEEEIMKQLAEEMYDQFVSPQYNPKTETKSRTSTTGSRSGGGGGRGTQGERERFALGQLINQLPEKPTAENFKQFADYLDTNEINYTIKDGKLIIGKKGKKMDEIDFTDPGFKTKFSKFATLPAFVNPNAYNVQQNNTGVTQEQINAAYKAYLDRKK